MAAGIHRTTLDYRRRGVDESDPAWLVNPDAATVALLQSTPRERLMLVGDTLSVRGDGDYTQAEVDAIRRARIDAVTALRAGKQEILTTGYSPAEMSSWPVKDAEAKAYVDEAQASTTSPMLAAEAQARGVTTGEIVARVQANSAAFRSMHALIAGNAGKLSDQLDAATTVSEIDAIDIDAGWPF